MNRTTHAFALAAADGFAVAPWLAPIVVRGMAKRILGGSASAPI